MNKQKKEQLLLTENEILVEYIEQLEKRIKNLENFMKKAEYVVMMHTPIR